MSDSVKERKGRIEVEEDSEGIVEEDKEGRKVVGEEGERKV
jgi:hypothetical protein